MIHAKQLLHKVVFIIIAALSISAIITTCSKPTQSDWDWWKGSDPQIVFLTNDWRHASNSCFAGDSLTIGFVDIVRANERERVKTALLFSASGDTEVVNIWERSIPTDFYYAAILIVSGTKIPTRHSAAVTPFDNAVSITRPSELVIVYYSTPLPNSSPQPYLVLTDSTYVIKP